MYKKINEFAQVISGHSFRKALESTKDGSFCVLQASNVKVGEKIVALDGLAKISSKPSRNTVCLENGDVVIVTRGTGGGAFRSCVFASNEKDVIPSASVLIIRCSSKIILPEFLSLYFNSSEGQMQFAGIVMGSHVQSLSRRIMEIMIEVPIPPIKEQETLITLDKTIRDLESVNVRQNQIRKQIFNASFKTKIDYEKTL
jgi:restriction endonuclease S subunit